jgi:hypothetical protein
VVTAARRSHRLDRSAAEHRQQNRTPSSPRRTRTGSARRRLAPSASHGLLDGHEPTFHDAQAWVALRSRQEWLPYAGDSLELVGQEQLDGCRRARGTNDLGMLQGNTLPAASNGTSSTGVSSLRPNARASSIETPSASAVAASFWARTVFPKLMAARNVPVGARS